MPFTITLPKLLLESHKIVLIPQLSTREKLVKCMPKYFSSGPKVFDCFVPLLGKQAEIVISPFLGYVGVCTFLEQILRQTSQKVSVHFFGTCAGYTNSNFGLGSLVSPDLFYIEESLGEISCIKNRSSGDIVLSTSFLSSESFSKFTSLHAKYGISLIDMELAFIKRTCLETDTPLFANLLVSDIWSQSEYSPSPKSMSTLADYPSFLDRLIKTFKSC